MAGDVAELHRRLRQHQAEEREVPRDHRASKRNELGGRTAGVGPGVNGLDEDVAHRNPRNRKHAVVIRRRAVRTVVGQAGDLHDGFRQRRPVFCQRAASDRAAPDEHDVDVEALTVPLGGEVDSLRFSAVGADRDNAVATGIRHPVPAEPALFVR